MCQRRARRFGSILVVLATTAACSGTPGDPAAAVATVQGQVLDAAGTPIMGETVAITCPTNGDPTLAPIGANGTYAANLTTSASVIGGENGRATCVFVVGSAANPRLRVTVTVAFTTAVVPHAIQRVDLRATS